MRRKGNFLGWLLLIPAALLVFLAWQYRGYLLAGRTLPAGLTMGGVPMEGKTRAQALNEIEVALATPLELRYVNQSISLFPDTIGLQYDAEASGANLDAALGSQRGLDGFVAHVLRRPLDPVAVDVVVSYSPERLDSFLTRVAGEYDRPAQEPVPTEDGLDFVPGQPGYALDLDGSRYQVVAALRSAVRQPVELVVTTCRATTVQGTGLGEVIQRLLDEHAGLVGGVFVKDLTSGAEVAINAGEAFSGLGLLKIALLEEIYRSLDPPLAPDVTRWLSTTISSNDGASEANMLLAEVLGDGDRYQGAQNVTDALQALGLVNTFMATPFGDEDVALTVATPANMQPERKVIADPRMQSTPLEMGLLLEMIYQCSSGGGTLLALYPDALDAAQCGQMLDWLGGVPTDAFIEAGVPPDVRVLHQQGLAADTHADAGLVVGQGADFLLVIYLYRAEWLPYEESAPLISAITTATYNYFNVVR